MDIDVASVLNIWIFRNKEYNDCNNDNYEAVEPYNQFLVEKGCRCIDYRHRAEPAGGPQPE
jgi:hypothetical protein